MLTLEQIKNSAEEIAMRYPVKRISLFGSFSDGNSTENSDVDLLVEFSSPNVSLFLLSEIKIELESILNADVDLVHAPVEEGSVFKIDGVVDIYEQ